MLCVQLEDSRPDVRLRALKALGKLELATLAQHVGAVVNMLEDDEDRVRARVLVTLGKLDPETLAQHALSLIHI